MAPFFVVVEAKWFTEKRESKDRETEKGDVFSHVAFALFRGTE